MKIGYFLIWTFIFSLFLLIVKIDSFLSYESQNLPESPDAIVVLGGGNGNRVNAAFNYFNKTKSKYIIFTAGPLFNTSMAHMMKDYAVSLGIDPNIIILEEESLSTKDHPVYLDPIFKKYKLNKIVIVTSKFHSRRSYFTFKHYFKRHKNISIYMISSNDNIDYSRWIFEHESIEKVSIEFLKTIVYRFIFLFN